MATIVFLQLKVTSGLKTIFLSNCPLENVSVDVVHCEYYLGHMDMCILESIL